VTKSLAANTNYTLGVTLRGSTVSVTLNGQSVLGRVYNAVTVDGAFGLLAVGGAASFDRVVVKTNDTAVGGGEHLLASAAASARKPKGVTQLTSAMMLPIVAEAKQRWADSGLLNAADLAQLDRFSVQIANFTGLVLGDQNANTILIDSDAAGHGWFVDPTPARDNEFRARPGHEELQARSGAARRGMDLLTVVMHEFGHALGLEHSDSASHAEDLMAEKLKVGVRRLISTEYVISAATPDLPLNPLASSMAAPILPARSEFGAPTRLPLASGSALLAGRPSPQRADGDDLLLPVASNSDDAIAAHLPDYTLGMDDDMVTDLARLIQGNSSPRSQ
jgi:hypothetical protein